MSTKRTQVIVIGLDGGEYKVLDHMISRGIMPNFAAIMEEGIRASLDCEVEELGQGWATFMTGLLPSKHGAFFWTLPYGFAQNIEGEKLWDCLSRAGKTVGIMNISYTFPPTPINGFIVSGVGAGLVPTKDSIFYYPDTLLDEIKRHIGNYIWGIPYSPGEDPKDLLKKFIEMTRYRGESILYLAEKYACDFVAVEFRGPDMIQHVMWNYIFPNPDIRFSDDDLRIKGLIEEYFRVLDYYIGKIREKFSSSDIMIISDHGFGQTKACIYINEFLSQRGYLEKQTNIKARAGTSLFSRIRRLVGPLYRDFLVNYTWFRKLNKWRTKKYDKIKMTIDWRKTKFYSEQAYGIHINQSGKCEVNEHDIKRLVKDLKSLRYPPTGEPVFERISLRCESETLNQKKFDRTPDIILKPKEYFHLLPEIDLKGDFKIFELMFDHKAQFWTGDHRRQGIFVAHGPDFRYNLGIKDIRMVDIMPTILRLLDVPPNTPLNGRVITEILV